MKKQDKNFYQETKQEAAKRKGLEKVWLNVQKRVYLMSGLEVRKRKAESEYVANPEQAGGKCWFGV